MKVYLNGNYLDDSEACVSIFDRGFMFGDGVYEVIPVYGGRLQLPRGASDDLIAALRGFRRQALHARRLSFIHPASGDTCEFESPLAEDLVELRAVLRAEKSDA